jgi:hypothetical protein
MSGMQYNDFSADGTQGIEAKGTSLLIMIGGTFGSGTLSLQKYSASRSDWVTIASWTSALAAAQEVFVGDSGSLRLSLSGASTPNITTDWWWE